VRMGLGEGGGTWMLVDGMQAWVWMVPSMVLLHCWVRLGRCYSEEMRRFGATEVILYPDSVRRRDQLSRSTRLECFNLGY